MIIGVAALKKFVAEPFAIANRHVGITYDFSTAIANPVNNPYEL